MTEGKKDKLLKKIQDLLRLSGDKNSTAEAETAAKKAQELIMKYNIDEAELHGQEPLGLEKTLYPVFKIMKRNEGKWIVQLFYTIAKFNFCDIVITEKWDDESYGYVKWLYLLGEPTNIEMVTYLSEQLVNRLRSIEKQEWSKYEGYDKRNTYRRGFLMGAVVGIRRQLESQQDHFREEESTNALVIRKEQELKEFKDDEFGQLKKSRSSSTSSRDGYHKGRERGESMSLRGGVRGKNGTLTLGN